MTDRKTSLNITSVQAERLAAIKARTGQTLTAILEAAIEAHWSRVLAEPALVLGYVKFDRSGDAAPEETTCRTCGQMCGDGIWLRTGLTHEQISFAGPFCQRCASAN